MIKKIVKIFSALLILLMVSAGIIHTYFFSETKFWEIPQLTTNLRAKEFCSCYFVMKRSEEYCLDQVKHFLPHGKHKIYEDQKKVTFKFIKSQTSSSFRNENIGCLNL
ncbi:hypothetical protein N9N67_08620 [Bacteriovoracaceae bacterium]|nr:hypothetical protein [Bacteriovoracaceae bacterium]